MALHEKLTSLAVGAANKANSLAKDAASKANTAIENGKLSLKINNEQKKIDEFTLPAALGVYWIANSLFAMLQEVVNIPFLRSFLAKQEKERAERQEQEKERVKLEKKAQAEAKRKAQEEMRKIQMERKLNKSIAGASREGIRAYARGRLYDPERYPTFPYQDPNDLAKQAEAEQAQKQAVELAKKDKKKGKPTAQALDEARGDNDEK